MDEVIELEFKKVFYFKDTKKGIIKTEQDEKDFQKQNICRFCDKKLDLIKVEIIVILLERIEDQLITLVIIMLHRNKVTLYHSYFTNSATMILFYFFKKLVDKKYDQVKFKIVPKTNEELISLRYGSIGFFDNYRFLSSSLDKLIKKTSS